MQNTFGYFFNCFRLSHHYGKSNRHKREAFKYSVKAADRFVYMGSYGDALIYSRKAFHMLTKRDESTDRHEFPDLTAKDFEKVIKVVECAMKDMAPPLRRSSMRLAYRSLRKKASDRIFQGFQELELDLERGLKDFMSAAKQTAGQSAKAKAKADDAANQKYSVGDVDTYDWEPSYATQHLNKPKEQPSSIEVQSQCSIS